jgi:type I restriction enzyme S subunit
MSDIGSMAILLPPLDEQVAIVAAIRERTANIDTGVDRAEREIGLLRAYATRLTADVVTGQVDARGVAQYLPEVVEEVIPEAQEVVDEEEAEGLLEAVTDDE